MGSASQAKRGKMGSEWEDSPSQFEEELALFDEMDVEMESAEGQAGHDVIPVGKYYISRYKMLETEILRSNWFIFDPLCSSQAIYFQRICTRAGVAPLHRLFTLIKIRSSFSRLTWTIIWVNIKSGAS